MIFDFTWLQKKMGISKLMHVKVPGELTIRDLHDPLVFKDDDVIGIDALIIVYEALTSGVYLADKNGKVTTHIVSICQRVMSFSPCKQLWVFDNKKKIEEKKETLKRRAFRAQELVENITTAVEDIQELLTAMGVTWVIAPPQIEAEAYLVELWRLKKVDHIYSRDSDVLAYGANMVCHIDKKLRVYRIKTILKALKMDLKTFRLMCCHLGNDFNEKSVGLTHLTVKEKMLYTPTTSRQRISMVIFSIRYPIAYQDNVTKINNIAVADPKGALKLLKKYECTRLRDRIKMM